MSFASVLAWVVGCDKCETVLCGDDGKPWLFQDGQYPAAVIAALNAGWTVEGFSGGTQILCDSGWH
jgi:hypothetical protein